jgi:formylglycine-generating enzyme required for sulfatase activity
MKTKASKSLQVLSTFSTVLWLVTLRTVADEGRFFRIVGPTAATIAASTPDGYITWTNTQIGTNYTVQTARSLGDAINWVDYIQIPVSNSVMTFRLYDPNPPSGTAFIPAGSFTMGDAVDDNYYGNASPTFVYVSAFYMDVNLVSYSQWLGVYSWATSHGYGFVHAGQDKATNHPVQMVDWYDVVKWSNARSQQVGLTPVYYTDAGFTQVYTNLESYTVYANWTANGYRLPTEAEWEKAARGGLSNLRFPWGNTIDWSHANYWSYWFNGAPQSNFDLAPTNGYNPAFIVGYTPYTSPVGYFAPNGYGLYDMAGNVFEWCWDWYNNQYGQPTTTNPTGPATGQDRVLRGGSWDAQALFAVCAMRNNDGPSNGFSRYGFRCVRGHL